MLLSDGNGMWLKACLIAGIRVKVWREGRDHAVKKKFWMKNVMSFFNVSWSGIFIYSSKQTNRCNL
jgi:hypothetical protein